MASRKRSERVAERRALAIKMKAQGIPYHVIARELQVSEGLVRLDIHRALEERRAQLNQNADLLIAEAYERTERIRVEAWRLALAEHVKVSNSGRVAVDPDSGEKIMDPGPNLTALALALRAEERLNKLAGVESAAKLEVSANLEITAAMAVLDGELERLRREVELERRPDRLELPPAESRTALDRLGIQPED